MTRGRTSIVIPSRLEKYLIPTIHDVLHQAVGDVEVIVILDGWWPQEALPDDTRVHYLHWGAPKGLRPSLNAAVDMATGEFLLKLDSHVAVCKGFDGLLKAACGESDVVVPAKRSLDPATWTMHKHPWWYYWLAWPWHPENPHVGLIERNYGPTFNAKHREPAVDDILTFQGSAWMLRRSWWEKILPEGMNAERYYWAQEAVEIGLSSWLAGGRCRIVKAAEYGHLWKGSGENKRTFQRHQPEWDAAMLRSVKFWFAQKGFGALIDKFSPLPTWPEDWRDQVRWELP